MITGYNTDVEHDGVVYHVQTEDKGTGTPLILSLVYVGGEVLASKRSRYDDLVAAGYDEGIVTERLQRQHKLICAAIQTGRIEDLKRLSNTEADERHARDRERARTEAASPAEGEEVELAELLAAAEAPPSLAPSPNKVAVEARAPAQGVLRVSLLEEPELRGGESVTLLVRVSRGAQSTGSAVPNARVVLKTLGTSFPPASTTGITENDGVARIFRLASRVQERARCDSRARRTGRRSGGTAAHHSAFINAHPRLEKENARSNQR